MNPRGPAFAFGALLAGCGVTATAAPADAPSITAPAINPAIAIAGKLTQGGWARGTVPPGTTALTLDGQPLAVAPDGSFFAAFDRDAGPAAVVVATLAGGAQVTTSLTIAPRAWEIERVAVPRRPGGVPDAEFQARRPGELARIAAARKEETGAQGWRQDMVWPVRARISGRFGAQRIYAGEPGAYHSGLDLAGGAGTAFVAPADGVVVLAAQAPFTLEGHLLMIDHGMGLNSAFLHASELLVKEGDVVRQGQVVARIGMTGRATGPHLHWGLVWKGRRLDPLLFLPAAP